MNTQPKPAATWRKQERALRKAALPLMSLLRDAYHPHMSCHVDSESVELFEGNMRVGRDGKKA